MLKRFLSVILLICVIVSASSLMACGGDSGESKVDGTTVQGDVPDNTDPDEPVDERAQYDPGFANVDMNGYVFKIGTRDDSTHGYAFHTRDLYAESETGDIINDAVFRRNKAVEEKFNCVIEMVSFNETTNEKEANAIVQKSFLAGDYSFDLLMTHMSATVDSVSGYFQNWMTFPNIDLSKPYWSQGVSQGLSVDNKLYIALSDLSFSANENIYCILFNKNLLKNYEVESPYELVANNQWTFDKFNQIIKAATADLDGDGAMGKADQYGYVNSNALNFLWSGGSHIAQKDANDIPHMDYMTPKTIEIFSKVYDIVNNPDTYKAVEWFDEDAAKIFIDGRGLFYSSQLCRVNDLRAAEFDFGIVPYPKYDVSQTRYYSYIDGHASMMAIPQFVPNRENTGMIIEQLSYLSYKDILPSYFDVVLNVKVVRDQESVDSLATLFDSKVIDFGYAYSSWELWFTFVDTIHKNNRDIVSAYEKIEAKSLKAMDDIVTKIKELE